MPEPIEPNLFHGTTHPFQPGDEILPAEQTGKSNYSGLYEREPWRKKVVFADASEAGAHAWGIGPSKRASDQGISPIFFHDRRSTEVGNVPRTRVFQVAPIGLASPGKNGDWVMPKARIQREVDIPRKQYRSDVPENTQGELPLDLDWSNWNTTVKHKGEKAIAPRSSAASADLPNVYAETRQKRWKERTFPDQYPPQHFQASAWPVRPAVLASEGRGSQQDQLPGMS